MTEQASPLVTFYRHGWENYQQALVKTIASLSSEQLALLAAAHYRSIGELLDHMIGARFNWFHLWMGEGDPDRDWTFIRTDNVNTLVWEDCCGCLSVWIKSVTQLSATLSSRCKPCLKTRTGSS